MTLTLEHVARWTLPKVEPGRALAASELRTLRDIAEIVLEGSPVDIPFEEIAENLDRFLVKGRSKRAWRCRLLLTLVEYTPIAMFGRPLRMLTKAERRRFVVERVIEGKHLYGICAKVRYLAMFGAYGDRRAYAATGFVPAEKRTRLQKAEAQRSLQ
ncbi:MAG TPA: hypothetical protein VHB21_26165, partial [Minicystis sp.]|nr:hypothetical protein [Minicystis sp.]